MRVRLALGQFVADKEKEWGHRIFAKDIAEAIGVSRNTISDYLRDDVKRPDLEIIGKLCAYFNVPSGPIPFLIYEAD